jgi:hypothetical protein
VQNSKKATHLSPSSVIRFGRATKANPMPNPKDETLQISKDCIFKILLAVGVLQAEEVQEIGITEDEISCQFVGRPEDG